MRAADAAACWRDCSAEYGDLGCGAGHRHGTGRSAWRSGGTAIRFFAYFAGAHPPAPAGEHTGFCILAVCHGGTVSLVYRRMGRPHPVLWSDRTIYGWRPLLLACKCPVAQSGLLAGRFCHSFAAFVTFACAAGRPSAEKNQKNRKKPLSLWAEMV